MPCIFIYLMDTVWWSLSIHSFWYIEPLNCWSKYLSKTINPAPLVWQCHYVIANTEKQQFGKSWNCMRYHKQSRENFKCLWQFYVDHMKILSNIIQGTCTSWDSGVLKGLGDNTRVLRHDHETAWSQEFPHSMVNYGGLSNATQRH